MADNLDPLDPLGVFASAFIVSALSGLAALLRSGSELTRKAATSALLNSGLLGLGISLLWYTKFQENVYFLIGVCVLAGLGGMTTIEFVLAAFRKGGFSISMGKPDLGLSETSDKKGDGEK